MSVRTGASYGVLGTEMNFTNIMIDYEKWFSNKWSIAGEFQKSCRVYPNDGNLYTFAGVMRFYLFDDAWKGYGLGGGGVAFPDFDNGSDGDMLFHLVAGLGVERKWNRFALALEGRYEHESNCFTGENYGMDKLMFFLGGKWYLGKNLDRI